LVEVAAAAQPIGDAMTNLKSRLLHYLVVFGAAFGLSLLLNADHILNAHGLSALKSAAAGALIAALVAGVDALKGAFGITVSTVAAARAWQAQQAAQAANVPAATVLSPPGPGSTGGASPPAGGTVSGA
jgi:hypothetical protein